MSDGTKKPLQILPLIHLIRGKRVILDADLARIYGVATKRLNEQVRRNAARFPMDFIFQLDPREAQDLGVWMRSQFATASKRNIKHRVVAFTEHGAIMAATILNSPRAVEMSVFVVRAFVKMREQLATTHLSEKRLAEIEKMLLSHDISLRDLYSKIKPLLLPPPETLKRRIGFREE